MLDAIYAAFAEGWSDPGGADGGMDVARRDLTAEAMFLARLVAELLPEEPEALGLLALMLHAEARRAARRDANGEYVPLAEQDPALWDAQMIDEAEALLRRAGDARRCIGRYQLEAALQSAHVHRRRSGVANWDARWCSSTMRSSRSPDRRWWRSIARWRLRERRWRGCRSCSAAGSQSADARLAEYQPYWAARAELLARTGAHRRSAAAPTRLRSVWSAIRRCGGFCRSGRRR